MKQTTNLQIFNETTAANEYGGIDPNCVSEFKTRKLNDRQYDLLMDSVRVMDAALSEANISCVMYGGTLLGALRHGGQIPWDDDADMLVPLSERERAARVLGALSGFELRRHTDSFWKFSSRAGEQFETAFKFPFVDIYFYTVDGEYVNFSAAHHSLTTQQLFFPLIRRTFGSLRLLSPINATHLLRAMYGAGIESTCTTSGFTHGVGGAIWRLGCKVDCKRLHRIIPFINQ